MGSFVVVRASSGPASAGAAASGLAAAPYRGVETARVAEGSLAVATADDPELPDTSLAAAHGLTAAYSGSMDNRAELAAALGLPPGATPAEVVIEAHRRWGDDAPSRYRGPFAAVVTDGRSIWASRDPLGLRSLFFARDASGIAVASEAKQALTALGRPLEPDLDVVEAIVFREYDDDTPAALRGAQRVPRGMTVRLDDRGAVRHRYWDPRSILETGRYTPAEIQERFDEVMATAAARSLLGDDVISLSGGIDSSAVAAFAAPVHRERTGRGLPALSVVYPNLPHVDESEYIQLVVDRLGLDLHTYEESSKTLDEVEGWMGLLDSPLPQFFLAESAEHYRKARSMGYRTMLTGELAEWIVERRNYLLPHLLLHGRWGPLRDHLARQRRVHDVGTKGMLRQLAPAFVTPRMERAWHQVRPATVTPPPWLDGSRLRRMEGRWATPARERWARFQVAIFMGPDIAAEAEDLVQAVTRMRVRRPFGDLDLIEFFLSLPAEQKFPDTHFKGLIRGLLRDRLPDALLDRPSKAVFNDAVLARADPAKLRALLIAPAHRIPGIDYAVLADHLERDDFDISTYEWMKNLAATHAFLARW